METQTWTSHTFTLQNMMAVVDCRDSKNKSLFIFYLTEHGKSEVNKQIQQCNHVQLLLVNSIKDAEINVTHFLMCETRGWFTCLAPVQLLNCTVDSLCRHNVLCCTRTKFMLEIQ